MFVARDLTGRAYHESFFFVLSSKLDFVLLSDTVRDKQQRVRKKKGEEEVRKTRLVVAALSTVCAWLP